MCLRTKNKWTYKTVRGCQRLCSFSRHVNLARNFWTSEEICRMFEELPNTWHRPTNYGSGRSVALSQWLLFRESEISNRGTYAYYIPSYQIPWPAVRCRNCSSWRKEWEVFFMVCLPMIQHCKYLWANPIGSTLLWSSLTNTRKKVPFWPWQFALEILTRQRCSVDSTTSQFSWSQHWAMNGRGNLEFILKSIPEFTSTEWPVGSTPPLTERLDSQWHSNIAFERTKER